MRHADPLRLTYIVVQDDDRLEDVSPFQGFGPSWSTTLWALRFLAIAPSSFLDRATPFDGLTAMRMGGMNRLAWLPLRIGALEQLVVDQIGFGVVTLSGGGEVADRVDAWIAVQKRNVLHVRAGQITDDPAAVAFCDDELRTFCRGLLDDHGQDLSAPRLASARQGVDGWMNRQRVTDGEVPGGHNITVPNQMVLMRADGYLPETEMFIGDSEAAYDAHAIASAQSVLDLRGQVGFRDFNRIYLPQPGLILSEPALFRHSYDRVRPSGLLTKPAMDALRRLQKQTGLWNTMEAPDVHAFLEDGLANALVSLRQEELVAHAYGVGLLAAQTVTAVLRLRPGVNHVFAALSRYARNIRAESPAARFKTPRLFDDVQRELVEAVGDARIDVIDRYRGSIKIVSDAPLELLPVGDLPLGLRFEVSRINATPGNLMMMGMVGAEPMTLDLPTLCNILVLSGFAPNDRLRMLVERQLDLIRPGFAGHMRVSFVRVTSEAEMIAALNASDATILVYDGHGSLGDSDGIGGVIVGKEHVDVWKLRGRARIPPIVVLSACDTHGFDAPTHATVGNGFLAAGATAVLATSLPIGGVEGAVLVGRLLYRLSEYVPIVLRHGKRVHSWGEIVSGLLRMVLATDLCRTIVQGADAGLRVNARANHHINSGSRDWYGAILKDIADETGLEPAMVARRARAVLARSEAIRYVHLGSPESILVDDGSVRASFFEPGIERTLGIDDWQPAPIVISRDGA